MKKFGKDYHALGDDEKLNLLLNTSLHVNPEDYSDDIVQDTLKNIYQVKEIQKINGEKVYTVILFQTVPLFMMF